VTYPVQNSLSSDDYLASRIVGFALGGGASSRLFMNLREDKSFTYGANARIGSDKLVASFNAFSSVRGSATDSAVNEIIYEIRNLRENGVTEEELESAKANLSGSFARSLESPTTIAQFAINMERYNLPSDYYASYLKRLNALTVEEVNAAAKRLLKPDNMYITIVGNGSEIQEGLMAFGEVKRYTNTGDPEVQIAINSEITAEKVIDDYILAIGGEDKVRTIKSSKMESVAEIPGVKLNINYLYDENAHAFSNKIMAMGNVAIHTLIKGGKATVTAGGQTQELSDVQYEAAKMNMFIFPELHYEDLGYSITLEGINDVEGQNAYKVIISNPTGAKQINYYAVDSGLKIKSESTDAGEIFYSEYQDIEGIKYPMMSTLKSPMIPVPLEAKVEKIEFNVSITDEEMN
jgi:zinc protease